MKGQATICYVVRVHRPDRTFGGTTNLTGENENTRNITTVISTYSYPRPQEYVAKPHANDGRTGCIAI